MPEYITDDEENFCDDSDREVSDEEIFMKKIKYTKSIKKIFYIFFSV